MTNTTDDFHYTCLFGGGAIRGTAHVGVIKAMEALGIVPQSLGGSSVGSIIAALYAVGYTSDELEEIFLSVNFELFRDISLGFNQKFALSKGEVFLDWLRELIEKKFYADNYSKDNPRRVCFKDINKDLIIITTNMKDFSCREFSTFETPDFEIALAVRISCCMPGLMRAVNLENELLVDGDLLKGKPMWMLSPNILKTNNRILEIRLEGSFTGSDQNPIEYVNGMYTCMTSSETSFISGLYNDCDRFDYLVINTGSVIVVDFNHPQQKRVEIMNSGYSQTVNYFTAFLPAKKKKIIHVYLNILDGLKKVKRALNNKKFVVAKNFLSELFIYLINVKDVMDADLFEEICAFQKLLFSNVKTGLLGYSRCKNYSVVLELINNLIADLSSRTAGLENYLNKFPV